MIVKMDKTSISSSQELAQRLYDKNLELENRRRKSAQARVPSDPNAWQQMRENFETIILENHNFSEKQNIEFALWQLHYRRIEEFRAHYSAASNSTSSTASQTRGSARPDRASKIRQQFKTFLSEATGFYHDLILKIRAKYGLPIGQFSIDPRNHSAKEKDKDSTEIKKGLLSCHRCLIYLGDLARYKGLYGEGDSKSRDYAAASSYYLQAASLWPSSGNPHHQLAILATYSGDELMAVYRYFRSLAADNPFSTARDNLIVAFEKNRQSYFQLHGDPKDLSIRESPARVSGRGRARVEPAVQSEELKTDTRTGVEGANEIRQTYKAFCVRFVRLNGILFTRTSLETFEEILSLVSSALQELLSSGPEEQQSLGTDAVENGLFVIILVSILIFTVNNVKKEADGQSQSYADIVQRTVLLQDALMAVYELIGQLLKRCLQLSDPSSSFLLPGILVFLEWMACCPDIIRDNDDKKTNFRSNFWNYCISFFNKLLSDGGVPFDDEDVSCFTNMTTYDEGENEYQLALREDFELRGFSPLQPAQAFLDFSREQFVNNSKKSKVARVKRILAAGRAIADMVTVDHKKVTFDSKLKRFVIGHIGDFSSDSQQKVETCVEGEEEEDEVIVFKPNVIENQTEVLASKDNRHEWLEQVQNTNTATPQSPIMPVSYAPPNIRNPYQFQPLMASINGQASTARGLQGLSLMENGQTSMVHPVIDNTSAYMERVGVTHVKNNAFTPSGADPSIVARNTSSTMAASGSRVSANRPMRHLGPPPGFSSIRPKQFDEVGSALGQNPLNDDYSWLDGYQLQSSMVQSVDQPLKPSSQFINGGALATTSFPFPGKQVQAGQGRPNLESSNSHNESLKQQYVPQQDQQQEQSIWKGRHFV